MKRNICGRGEDDTSRAQGSSRAIGRRAYKNDNNLPLKKEL